jgi:phage-related protein
MTVFLIFTPPIEPGEGTSLALTQETFEASYGDGYSQRVESGINSMRRTATVIWPVLSHADADTIAAFFDAHLKTVAFKYAVPPTVTLRKWVVESYERPEPTALQSSITAQLREVFDL